MIALVGANLEGGAARVNHTCRFGGHVVPAVAHPETRVVGNRWHTHTLSCTVPELAGGTASTVPLAVSLNGQQYTSENVWFAMTSA